MKVSKPITSLTRLNFLQNQRIHHQQHIIISAKVGQSKSCALNSPKALQPWPPLALPYHAHSGLGRVTKRNGYLVVVLARMTQLSLLCYCIASLASLLTTATLSTIPLLTTVLQATSQMWCLRCMRTKQPVAQQLGTNFDNTGYTLIGPKWGTWNMRRTRISRRKEITTWSPSSRMKLPVPQQSRTSRLYYTILISIVTAWTLVKKETRCIWWLHGVENHQSVGDIWIRKGQKSNPCEKGVQG